MIPAIQEINFPSYATLHQATVSFTEMGERTISTQVRIDGDVVPDFTGWELSFKGERFILNTKDPQAVKDNSTRNSLVDLTFVSWPVNELKRYFFFEPTSIDASTAIADKYVASVNLPVEDFAVLFNKVLKYYFGDKVVFSLYMSGQGQYSTDRALVEINYTYIWDVLVKFFEIYGVRWRIEYDESDDVYTIKAGWPTTDIDINDHDFEYGYKGGLVRFERQVQDVDIHNILLGRGGEKNIPYRYFKRVDPQNPDWAADPDAIPELANIYFDRLRDINFRWYVRGWMQNPNHDTSWEDGGYVYPTYTITSDSPYYFAYEKGRTDEKFNPVEYVKDDESIADYGEHWGALDDNDDIFPTIQSVSRDPLGRIDETVAVSEIVTDDISAMAQNAAVEKSINRMVVSNPASTTHTIRSEFFTIPSGTTGNIDYAWVGPTEGSGVVHIDTVQSSIVVEPESGGNDLPISGIPAGTYRLRLDLALYVPSGRSADGTFGLENIRLTTSSMETDAWKPTFDIWVKNIWGTEKQDGETDVQYAERVWLPILGDRVGNEAKIVFSTGFMSVSEDYEFPIVSYPVHDTSKSINGVPSEWRITLRKSDAEFDATGLYIPNASTGGKPVAGDKFFFIGIDMPHRYATLAEEDLNTYKSAQLDTEAAISPTWIMNLDKVRVHTLDDQEYGLTLAERLAAGGKVWIKDKRFTPGKRLQLYVQSITYTWNEPTVESPYIVPDIEVVLSDKVVAVDSVVQRIQNDVSSIKNQYARISDVEAVVRSVAEPIFLKKTGESDSSDSPTQFSSKVTSKGFRQGGVGGSGWGIYRDNTSVWAEAEAEAETRTRGLLRAVAEEKNTEGDTVFEADRIVVRKELQVNSLVINQISYLGGKEIISAAKIEVSKVIETDNGYVCYFDQRRNSVANNFVVNDIAMGQVFDPYNAELRYYKALVTAVDIDSITISKTQKVGSGVPRVGDVIVQYGNTTQSGRQYVIVRDVVGGGYERMLSGLNSLNADGDEYYFAGRESSGTGPRWFVGSHEQNGDYAEYENGVLTIKANVVFKAGQVIPGLSDLTDDVEALEYLKTALPKSDTIITGGLILSKVIALRDANNVVKSGINGDPALSNIAAWYGGPMADKQASPTPASYAQSLFRFDGSGYLAGGNIYWNNQGYGGIPGITWSNDGTQDIVTIGANVRLASVDGDTVTDLLNAVNELMDLFEVVNGNIHVKNNRGFYSDSFISAGGLSDGGGSAGGNANLAAQTYGGTLSATGINPINFYSKEKVDELLLTAGSVRSVAGVSPVSGDIPVASLKSALGLGAAAAYGVGSVASGNTGLVTGGDVWTAIDELPEPMVFKGSLGTGGTITSLPAASSANEGFTYKVITAGTYRGTAAKVGDTFISNGSSWILIPSGDEPEGTVTSVGLSMPTGFSVSSSPITSSGTLTVAFASGYSLPTTAKQSNWDTAYGWGNHANAGYLLASTAASTYATITALNGVSGRVTTLEGRTNWDTYFGVDENGDIYVKKNGTTARGFYSYGFVSAGGASDGSGTSGVDLAAVWANLTANTGEGLNKVINVAHIPALASISGNLTVSRISDIETWISEKGYLTDHQSLDGYVNDLIRTPASEGNYVSAVTKSGKIITVTYATLPASLPASDVYSWAKAETKPSYAFSEITGTASASQIPTLAISKISGLQTALDGKQPLDADLTAIAGLTGTSGFLKKTAANTWALDTNTYLTTSSAASTYVSGVSLNGNYLRVTKSGANTDLTIPFATQAQIPNWAIRTAFDPDTVEHAIESNYGESGSTKTNVPSEFLYGSVLTLSARGFNSNLSAQFLWDVRHGTDYSGWLWFRTKDSSSGWRDWTKVYTELSLTKSVLTDLLESSDGYYVKKSGDTMTGALTVSAQVIPVSMEFRNMSSSAGNGGYIDFHFNNSTADYTSRIIESASGILSISGGLSLGTTLQLGDGVLSWDGSANAWKLTGNFYATGFISAGGVSSGGGTAGVDLTAVWNNLIANTGEGLNKKIHTAHLPTVTITGTNISGTATYSGTGGSASTLTLNLTATDTTYSPGTGISISSSNVISLSASEYYSATTSRTANTVLAAPNGSSGAASFRALVAADIPTLTKSKISDFPTNVSAFTNDAGYITSYTDTKNTAGSTNTSSKIFLIGATSQAANPQTYSHDTVYVGTDGHLYSDSKQVVNLSGSQALTNKTYNGYTLAAACAKGVTDNSSNADVTSSDTNLITGRTLYYQLAKKGYTTNTGTVTSVAAGTGLSGGTITTSGTISLAASGVTAGTYYKTTVDTYGRVTSGSYANLSAAINGDLTEGSSNPVDADYYIAQYAGGGTSTTSYHRRPHSALYNYINGKLATAHAGLDKTGTVTSVAMTVPTGLSVSGTPITTSGTLAISLASGYSIPTTAKQSNWDTAYGWGNHANAGYLLASTAASTYLPLTGGIIRSASSYARLRFTTDATIAYIQAGTSDENAGNLYLSGFNGYVGTNLYLKFSNIYATGSNYTVYHSGNANLSTVAWKASTFQAGSLSQYGASSIELNTTSSTGHGGYIDFHYNGSTADYTSRIIENASGRLLLAAETVYTTGNIGAGTASPAYPLHVEGLAAAGGFTTISAYGSNLSSAGWYTVYTANGSNATGQAVILQLRRNYYNTSNEAYTISVNVAYNGKVSITQLSGGANAQLISKIRVDYVNSGALTIAVYYSGTTANTLYVSGIGSGVFCAPTAVSSVNGTAVEFTLQPNGVASNSNIVATGAITAGSASDARLKTNIQSLSADAAKRIVMGLNPVTFTWNEKATELFDQYKGDDLGMIAQEVEPYLPQAVGTIFEKYKRLDYTKVISPLVKVAQDHESRIRQLEARVAELEMENERLRS